MATGKKMWVLDSWLYLFVIIIIIIIIFNPRKNEGKKTNLEIENAGKTTAPGGRPTQSRNVTKHN